MITDSTTFLASRALLELTETQPLPRSGRRRTDRTSGLKSGAARLATLARDVLSRRPTTSVGVLLKNEP
jgi:hypothetical protein